jgi:hypothetical protein
MTGTSFARVGSTLLCSVLLVAACGGSGDSALPEGVTAVAGQDTLKQQQLEQLLVAAPEPPTLDDARSLVHSWVNFALVGDALDRDPTLAQYQEDATRTNLNAHAIRDYANLRKETGREATDAEIDSILRSNTVRSFDVYAIHGDPRVDSVAFIDGIRLLERLRDASIANGGDVAQAFSGLTRAEQDRFDLVRMPAVSRSELPGNLADQLWPLGVGEITQVIAGGPGVQIFTRRNTADFRADVARWLKPRIQAREDLALVDSIVDAHGFKLASDAVPRARAGLAEPGVVPGDEPIATWNGGEFGPDKLAFRIGGLNPNERASLASAPDTVIASKIIEFARADLLYQVLSPEVTPERRAEHQQMTSADWREAVDTLRASRERLGDDGRDPYRWLQAVVSGRAEARALPGDLGGVLRRGVTIQVDSAGMAAAVAGALRVWNAPTP